MVPGTTPKIRLSHGELQIGGFLSLLEYIAQFPEKSKPYRPAKRDFCHTRFIIY
jgi:hypothetical protein